jgi:hypothetical protein
VIDALKVLLAAKLPVLRVIERLTDRPHLLTFL